MTFFKAIADEETDARLLIAGDVRAFREAALANGYRPVPVESGGKRPIGIGWTSGVSLEVLQAVVKEASNTGALCEGLRVIDVDVDDKVVAAKVIGLVLQHLPNTGMVRRRKNSSRVALFYRAAEGTPGKRKVGDSGHAVEVLGRGQQVVVHGTHPSGAMIEWLRGRSPANVPLVDLPVLTEENIGRFLTACEFVLGPSKSPQSSNVDDLSNLLDNSIPRAAAANAELGAGLDHGWFENLSAPDKRQLIERCLSALDNTKDDPRDRWLRVLFAMADAGDKGCTDARELALVWSQLGAGWTNEADFDTAWNSHRPGGITVGTLIHLAERAGADLSTFRPSLASTDAAGAAPFPSLLKALRIGDLPAIPPKREWLHGTHLIRGAVSLLVSPGGRGKSTFLLVLAVACASGRELLGSHVFGGSLRVLYINAEDSVDELTRRIRAAMLHHGLQDCDVASLRVIGADRFGVSLMAPDKAGPTLNRAGWDALEKLLDAERPDVLILDPLVSLLGGVSLNDNSAAALLQGQLVQLATRRKVGIVVAHHTAKFRETNTADAAMGAASFVNLARVSLSLESISEEDAPKLGIAPWDARSILRLVGTKQNLTKPSIDDNYFRLVSVRLQNAAPPVYPHGDEVGVIELFRPNLSASPFPKVMTDAALAAIRQAQPPLSPKTGLADIAAAVSTQTPINDRQAKAIVDHLIRIGEVRVDDVAIQRPGRGPYRRQGLIAATSHGAADGPAS